MKKLIWVLLVMSVGALAQPCSIVKDLTEGPDTLLIIRAKGTALSCMGTTQLKGLLVADSAYPACMESLQVLKGTNALLVQRSAHADTALALLTAASEEYQKESRNLREALLKTDSIVEKKDSILILTNNKLTRCEAQVPTIWERLMGAAGFAFLGFLVGAAIF